MEDDQLKSETCAECGRLTLVEDKAMPIQAGPIPVVPVPPPAATLTTCDECGKALVDPGNIA